MSETFITPASSNLARVDYEQETQQMTIQFKSGREYLYHGVPYEAYRGLMHARSAGEYFNGYIKDRYEYEEI